MKTNLLLLLLFTLITAPLILSCSGDSNAENESSQERKTAVAGYEISLQDLSRVVQVSSVVEPENAVTIAGRMSGLITELNVREGDQVNRGDVMLRFDTDELQAELQRARAELELESARYERTRQLIDQNAVSSAEYEGVKAAFRIAESEVALRETRIGFGTIRAAERMTILERHVETGDAVNANDPLFLAADLSRLVVRAGIPERDVIHLRTGQEAEIRIDAYPETSLKGTIQRVFPSSDSGSRLFTVEITLRSEQQDFIIRPGYLARIHLDADRRPDVIAVPSESLLASEREEIFVYIINNENRLERRDVVKGIERRNWTEIRDGLETGDIIVGGNPGTLREGLLVEVSRWVRGNGDQTSSRH